MKNQENEPEKLNPFFEKQLRKQGLLEIITDDVCGGKPLRRVLRRLGGLSNDQMNRGIFNRDRDELIPRIRGEIDSILAPWTTLGVAEKLPTITALEVGRRAGIDPSKVRRLLIENPIEVQVRGDTLVSQVNPKNINDEDLTLSRASSLGVSPKRVIREVRYKSRLPGGGPAQKEGIQDAKIPQKITRMAQERTRITFGVPGTDMTRDNREEYHTEALVPRLPDTTPLTTSIDLSPIVLRSDIRSSEGPFLMAPELRIQYPPPIIATLIEQYKAFNAVFNRRISANQEWPEDYQYCRSNEDWFVPWIQIDSTGLTPDLIARADKMESAELTQTIRDRIFEFESSIAMYQLSEKAFPLGSGASNFDIRFRRSLDGFRERFGRKIALLAVTESKYRAMRFSEFGRYDDARIEDTEVSSLTGFDTFFGPTDFLRYLEMNNGNNEYLLFVRASESADRFRSQNKMEIPEQSILSNASTRRIVKKSALTFNVDNPAWSRDSNRRINDTKRYLPNMDLGIEITDITDLERLDTDTYLSLNRCNVIANGRPQARAKPELGAYGSYGQFRGDPSDPGFRKKLKRGLELWGNFLIQPEIAIPLVINSSDGEAYGYSDRVFFGTDGENYQFIGGFRYLMPISSEEYRRGRMHANAKAITGEILDFEETQNA